jgi:hypothetical protein
MVRYYKLELFGQPDLYINRRFPMRILINHLGYDPLGPKQAVIQGAEGDQVHSFRIFDTHTRQQVLYRQPEHFAPVPGWKDWLFWTFDFTELTRPGSYQIACETNTAEITAEMRIEENLLERYALSDVVAYFKSMRCSGANDRADRKLRFEGDPGLKPVDVHGGWYDATADYGKHLSHLCFSTYFNPQQLPLVAWSLFQSLRELKRKGDPSYRQLLRRMTDEGLFGADYLVRIHKPGGSFYITVSGFGPEKRPQDRRFSPAMRGFRLADPDKKDAYAPTAKASSESVYESSYRSGAGMSIAALAAASACGESGGTSRAGDYLPHVYLQAAQEAFAFLEEHNPALTNDGIENIVDDYCALLAVVELVRACQAHQVPAAQVEMYRLAAKRRAQSLISRLASAEVWTDFWRADCERLYVSPLQASPRPFFHAADAGLPVVSLLAYLAIAHEEEKPAVLDAVHRSLLFELKITAEGNNPFGYARQLVQNRQGVKRVAFFFPHDSETAPWWQGENARLASLAAAARLAAPYFEEVHVGSGYPSPAELHTYAQNQLNWIMGLNPYDACMLHGSGRNNPEYLFFDAWEYKNLPGGIVNGITGGFFDENGIDFMLPQSETGQDSDWRWTEQWLPHAAWFLLAAAAR